MSEQATKTLVPKLRFPEFRDAGEWEKKNLGDLSKILRGGSPRPIDDYITSDVDGLNWLKIADVDKGSKYVTFTKERVLVTALSKTRVVKPDDLIMSNSMSFGRPYILKIESCIHDGWIAVTKIDERANRDYLYYLILSPTSQEYFLNNAAGSGVQNLNADIIKLLPVLIPKYPEQQKIADCLSSVDELITTQTQKIAALKAHKKGLMQQLFPTKGETVPKLRFPEFREAGEWEKKSLGKVCNVLNNLRKPITSSAREKGIYPYYGASGIVDYVKNYIFDDRLLLIGEDGAKWGAFESTAFIVEGKYWVNNHAHVLRAKTINDTFLENYIVMLNIAPFITGAAPPKLTLQSLKSIPVPAPLDIDEQQKIADCLSSVDELITTQTQKIAALKAHKKGLMQQLFPSFDEVGG